MLFALGNLWMARKRIIALQVGVRLRGAEVAPQGLKRACKLCQSGLSGLRRNQATSRSTSGCAGLANGVLQTFPRPSRQHL